jgi:hypothetical protein
LYYEKQQSLGGGGLAWYCEPVRLSFMQNFLALASLSAMLTTLAWSYVTQPAPQPDRQAYQACTQLHPQRYCAITHLGQ